MRLPDAPAVRRAQHQGDRQKAQQQFVTVHDQFAPLAIGQVARREDQKNGHDHRQCRQSEMENIAVFCRSRFHRLLLEVVGLYSQTKASLVPYP